MQKKYTKTVHLSGDISLQTCQCKLFITAYDIIMYFVRCFAKMRHRYTCIEMQHEYVYMQKYENTNVQSDSKIT